MAVQPYSATAPIKSLAGTEANPGVTFTGDADSGLFSPGANEVGITTGGTQRLLIGADGAVDIAGNLVLGPNSAPAVKSDTTGVTGADQITNMMSLTQAEYDAIVSPDANTFYVITA